MSRSLRIPAALAAAAVLFAVGCIPSYARAAEHAGDRSPTPAATTSSAAAKSTAGTITGTIKAPHAIKQIDVVVYKQVTARDGSKAWLPTGHIVAIGYGVAYNKKTHVYSFHEKPGSYRLEFNGEYTNGKSWGVVTYGPGKPAGAPWGKTVTVRRAATTHGIGITAAGTFGNLPLPPQDDTAAMNPYDPQPGGAVAAVTGAWPTAKSFTYGWQLLGSHAYLSFKKSITVPGGTHGKTLMLYVTAYAYGSNGAGVSVSAGIGTS
jgi:hypothetical protein